ncbi:hypothetical protein [Rheinheimera sp.]|uniref:hypothetical protein n=1 Tax=Rheinheimera sp. TaxID=1869214 RepID=UPI00273264C4|nr:hypothetical protein [Rheinheimera sp.]MDP2716120.1 hypothetical protein [Rheinheimera sp.]
MIRSVFEEELVNKALELSYPILQLTRPPPEQLILVVPPETSTTILPEVHLHVIGSDSAEAEKSNVTNNILNGFISMFFR